MSKFRSPRQFGILNRERLFTALDRLRAHPIIWIAGPAGAGKTALAASYAAARAIPTTWYRMDGADRDPAVFIQQFASAVSGAENGKPPGKARAQARSQPEAPAAAFEALCARLPSDALVMLDDYQNAASDWLNGMLREVAAHLRSGTNLVIVSRMAPPPELASLLAARTLATLGWDELRFTAAEARHVIQGDFDEGSLAGFIEQLDGWAAGLALARPEPRASGVEPHLTGDSRDTVFQFFATEVLGDTSERVREFLLRTAFLPRVTATMAEQLTGDAQAAKMLDELYRRNLFIDRRGGPEGIYQYFPLFRDFLLTRAREAYTGEERRDLQRRAAALLEANGAATQAIGLYGEAGEWDQAVRLILSHADEVIAQGKHQVVTAWIAAIPQELRQRSPWLDYWQGVSRLPFSSNESRAALISASDGFKALGDTEGALMSYITLMATRFWREESTAMPNRWVAELEQLLSAYSSSPAQELEPKAGISGYSRIFQGLGYQTLDAWSQRALALLRGVAYPTQRLLLANFLLEYDFWQGRLQQAGAVIKEIKPLLLAAPQSDVLPLLHWYSHEAAYCFVSGNERDGLRAIEQALSHARDAGVHAADYVLLARGAALALSGGDTRLAAGYLERMAGVIASQQQGSSYYDFLCSGLALLEGDFGRAIECARTALLQARSKGNAYRAAIFQAGLAQALIAHGEHGPARELLAPVIREGRDTPNEVTSFRGLLLLADSLLTTREDAAALEALREALAIGKLHSYANFSFWLPAMMSRLLSRALEAGIETEYVQWLIRKRALKPPAEDIENWPWRVRITTLGGFALLIDSAPLRFEGKAQKKPLELLKAIVAQGGRDVNASLLAGILWPDAESEAAEKSFEAALYRLRKLLGSDQAITLAEGKLGIDSGICQVDVFIFEDLLRRAESALSGRTAPPGEAAALTDRALELYRGDFLAGDEEKPWLLAYREQLSRKFVRHVVRLGQHYEREGKAQAAESLYERALELTPLAETMYRRLMALQAQHGRQAEALETYRRCRHMLSIVLGVEPSAETRFVYQTVRTGGFGARPSSAAKKRPGRST